MPDGPTDDLTSRLAGLYDAHGAGLYRYALLLTMRHDAAADVVQEVFAAVWAGAALPDDPARYLMRAVRNRALSVRRRRALRGETPLGPVLVYAAGGPAVDPAIGLALDAALAALPVDQRETVHLHVFEGWSFREIAEATDVSINTVAARYRYALAHLKRTLSAMRPEGSR